MARETRASAASRHDGPFSLLRRGGHMRSARICGAALLLGCALPLRVWAQLAGPEFQVNTYTYGQERIPAVASDSAGNFVVAWQGDRQIAGPYGDEIFAQRFNSAG